MKRTILYWPTGQWTAEECDVDKLTAQHGAFRGVMTVDKTASAETIGKLVAEIVGPQSAPALKDCCEGVLCPSKKNCKRWVLRHNGATFAAFYARREAGADACDAYLPVKTVSTFQAAPSAYLRTAELVESEGGEV